MTEKRERNIYTHVCFASIISGISLILSIVMMLRYNYRTNLETDYLGAIVAVLSLAVAVFVGVQIYQSFNLKRDIDEQNKKLAFEIQERNKRFELEIDNRIDEKIKDYDHNVEAITKQLYGIVLFGEGRNENALESFMEALEEANKSSYKQPIEGILSFIKGMEMEKRSVNPISIETSNRYIGILQNLNIDNANEYISYIRSLEENENRTR